MGSERCSQSWPCTNGGMGNGKTPTTVVQRAKSCKWAERYLGMRSRCSLADSAHRKTLQPPSTPKWKNVTHRFYKLFMQGGVVPKWPANKAEATKSMLTREKLEDNVRKGTFRKKIIPTTHWSCKKVLSMVTSASLKDNFPCVWQALTKSCLLESNFAPP